MTRRLVIAGAILAGAVVAVAGLFAFSGGDKDEQVARAALPQWVQPAGDGLFVPACGSTSAQTSCSGGQAIATISWRLFYRHTEGRDPGADSRGADVTVSGGPKWTWQPDNGSVTWTGAQSSQTYGYLIEWFYDRGPVIIASTESGSFTTPNCTTTVGDGESCGGNRVCQGGLTCDQGTCRRPLSVSCSASPASAVTGQSVTWSASVSGGTGTYRYVWSGSDGLSGTTQSVDKTYTNPGTKSGNVHVTSGGQNENRSCSNSVAVAQANRAPNPPGGSGIGGGGGGAGTPLASGGGISVPPTAGAGGVNSGTPAFGESPPGACTNPLRPTFTWTYPDPDGDPQGWFELEADNNSGFPSPEIDTGQTAGATTTYQAAAGALAYNTTYYWRVRVWDNRGAVSEWSNGATFSTQPHAAPTVAYTWSPTEPAVNQRATFTDQSSVSGGASKRAWTWAFADATPSSSSIQNPQTQFASGGGKVTSLILEDTDRLSCGLRQTVTVSGAFGAPAWQEVAPD